MERHLKAHLYDISTAIDEIQSFFEQVPRRFDEYGKNLMLRRAIERNIGIIGEAVSKILKENPGIEISNARAIIATPGYPRLRCCNGRCDVENRHQRPS